MKKDQINIEKLTREISRQILRDRKFKKDLIDAICKNIEINDEMDEITNLAIDRTVNRGAEILDAHLSKKYIPKVQKLENKFLKLLSFRLKQINATSEAAAKNPRFSEGIRN